MPGRSSSLSADWKEVQGETYRIDSPILAILSRPDGKRLPISIPKGSTVTVVSPPLNGTRLVEINWDGDIVLTFTTDLRENGTHIPGVVRSGA